MKKTNNKNIDLSKIYAICKDLRFRFGLCRNSRYVQVTISYLYKKQQVYIFTFFPINLEKFEDGFVNRAKKFLVNAYENNELVEYSECYIKHEGYIFQTPFYYDKYNKQYIKKGSKEELVDGVVESELDDKKNKEEEKENNKDEKKHNNIGYKIALIATSCIAAAGIAISVYLYVTRPKTTNVNNTNNISYNINNDKNTLHI